MSLWTPPAGSQRAIGTRVDTSVDGVTVTASATPHTKGTKVEIVASSPYDAYGITVQISSTATASASSRSLLDILIGSGLATVLIPDLLAGNTDTQAANIRGNLYHFPLYIPAGTRIGTQMQALTGSRTALVALWLHEWPGGAFWCGSRVTAYGPNTATSSGVAHSPGNGSYAAATEIVASSANPIRALQLGIDLSTDTTGVLSNGLARVGIGSTPTYIIEHLPFHESSTNESVSYVQANLILAQQRFNIPAATRLVVSAMRNVAEEGRGFALYGVD